MRLSARLIRPSTLALRPVTVRLTNTASRASSFGAVPSLRKRQQSQQADKDRLPHTIPNHVFEAAAQDGMFSIPPEEAVAIARACVSLAINGGMPSSVEISKEVAHDPSLVARVTFALTRSSPHSKIAQWIMLSLAFEGEPIATMISATLDIVHNNKASQKIQSNLRSIAEEGKVPQAMVLQGKYLERKGQYLHAAEWYEKAMAASKPVADGIDKFFNYEVPQPWEAYRSIKEKLGEHEEAKRALAIGMEEYGTLGAYKQGLPDSLNSGDFTKYEALLNKCAMMGDETSCHELGNLYLSVYLTRGASGDSSSKTSVDSQNMKFASKYPTPELIELAVEWHKIAAAAGNGQSALVLAGLFRQENKLDLGMEYLNLASQDSRCKEASRLLREQWNDTETKVDIKKYLTS